MSDLTITNPHVLAALLRGQKTTSETSSPAQNSPSELLSSALQNTSLSQAAFHPYSTSLIVVRIISSHFCSLLYEIR